MADGIWDIQGIFPLAWSQATRLDVVDQVVVDPVLYRGAAEPETPAVALKRDRLLVVEGRPFVGKSTLLRWLASRVSAGKFGLDGVVPVLLPLGELNPGPGGQRPAVEEWILARLTQAIEGAPAGRGTVLRLLDGQVLLLLDGLDEIRGASEQASVVQELLATLERWPRVRSVLTTRPSAGQVTRTHTGWSHYSLREFEDLQVHRFLDRWYSSDRRCLGSSKRCLEQARLEMERSRSLFRLCHNPLLLTIKVLSQHWLTRPGRDGARVGFLRAVVTTLADTWERAKRPGEDTALPETGQVMTALAWLAHAMEQDPDDGGLTARQSSQHLARGLKAAGVPRARAAALARDLLSELVHRSTLLEEYFHGGGTFSEDLFQVYLCAVHLAQAPREAGRRRLLSYQIHCPRWANVIPDLVGAIPELQAATVVLRSIMEANSRWEDLLHRDRLLAVRCLAEDPRVEPGLARRAVLDLLDVVTDLHPEDRRVEACVCLGSLPPRLLQHQQVQDRLREVFHQSTGSWRRHLVPLLASQVGLLISTLGHVSRGEFEDIVTALAPLAEREPGIAATITRCLGHRDFEVREAVFSALAYCPSQERTVTRALLGQLGTSWSGLMKSAIAALAPLAGQDLDVTRGILRCLDSDEGEEVRVAAVSALAPLAGQDPDVTAGILRCLSGHGQAAREAAVAALAPLAGQDTEVTAGILGCLDDDEREEVREAAVAALAPLAGQDTEVTAGILGCLDDDEREEVREAAVAALAPLAGQNPGVTEAFIRRLDDWSVHEAVFSALEPLAPRDPGIAAAFLSVLEDREAGTRARNNAAAVLAPLAGRDPAVARAFLRLLHDDTKVSYRGFDGPGAAVTALAPLAGRDAEISEALLQRMADGDAPQDLRTAAASALVEAVSDRERSDSVVILSLLRQLGMAPAAASPWPPSEQGAGITVSPGGDDDPGARAMAVTALAPLAGRDPAVTAALLERLDDGDSSVRDSAAAALAPLVDRDPRVTEALRRQAVKGRSGNIVAPALAPLVGKDPSVTEALLEGLGRNLYYKSCQAIMSALAPLVGQEPSVTFAFLQRLDDEYLGAAAASALIPHVGHDATIRDAFIGRLEDQDAETGVRTAAAAALAPGVEADPTIADALERRLRDHDPEVIQAAATALAPLVGKDPRITDAFLFFLGDERTRQVFGFYWPKDVAARALAPLAGQDSRVRDAFIGRLSMDFANCAEVLAPLATQDTAVKDAFLEIIEGGNGPFFRKAALALAPLAAQDSTVKATFLEILGRAESARRRVVIRALAPLAGQDPSVRDVLLERISCWESDSIVRVEAARVLAPRAVQDPGVCNALLRCLDDEAEWVCEAAISTLGPLVGQVPGIERALIRCRLGSRHWGVVDAAASWLAPLAGQEPSVTRALANGMGWNEAASLEPLVGQDLEVTVNDLYDLLWNGHAFGRPGDASEPRWAIMAGRAPEILDLYLAHGTGVRHEKRWLSPASAYALQRPFQDMGSVLAAVVGEDPAITNALLERLDDPIHVFRESAIVALAPLVGKEPRVARAVHGSLDDDCKYVRFLAIRVLSPLAGVDPAVTDALLRGLDDACALPRQAAVRGLAPLAGRDGRVKAALLIGLTQAHDHSVRSGAAVALATEAGQDPFVKKALLSRLDDDEDSTVRLAVTSALAPLVHDQDISGALIGRLGDRNREVRNAAVDALTPVAGQVPAVADALLRRLVCLGEQRLATERSLWQSKNHDLRLLKTDTQGVVGALAPLAGQRPDVMAAVLKSGSAETLATLAPKDPHIRDALIERLAGPDPQARVSAVKALSHLVGQDPMVTVDLTTLVDDDSWYVLESAIRTLAPIAGEVPAATEAIARHLDDDDRLARVAAVEALTPLAGKDPGITAALVSRLDDDDEGIRTTVTRALAPLATGDSTISDALIEHDALLRSYQYDSEGKVRLAVIEALAPLLGEDARVQDGLVGCLFRGEKKARAAAVKVLGPLAEQIPRVMEAFISCLDWEESGHLYWDAVRILTPLTGRRRRIKDAFMKCLRSDDRFHNAAEALAPLAGQDPRVLAALLPPTGVEVQLAVAKALTRPVPTTVREVLVEHLAHDIPEVRSACVNLARPLASRYPEIADALLRRLGGEDTEIVALALAPLAAQHPEVVDALLRLLREGSAGAARALAPLAGRDPGVTAALLELSGTGGSGVREACVEALRQGAERLPGREAITLDSVLELPWRGSLVVARGMLSTGAAPAWSGAARPLLAWARSWSPRAREVLPDTHQQQLAGELVIAENSAALMGLLANLELTGGGRLAARLPGTTARARVHAVQCAQVLAPWCHWIPRLVQAARGTTHEQWMLGRQDRSAARGRKGSRDLAPETLRRLEQRHTGSAAEVSAGSLALPQILRTTVLKGQIRRTNLDVELLETLLVELLLEGSSERPHRTSLDPWVQLGLFTYTVCALAGPLEPPAVILENATLDARCQPMALKDLITLHVAGHAGAVVDGPLPEIPPTEGLPPIRLKVTSADGEVIFIAHRFRR